MISRRKILSRSKDALNINDDQFNPYEEEDDIWFSKDKLFKNHIQEVLFKWDQIDDEIWAKVICMERNRRVAKAYARAPILTINGCDNGFDGYRIGLNGFDNPMRDQKTEDLKRNIGLGIKVKMDQDGNVLIKRISKTNVYVKIWTKDVECPNSVANEIIKANGLLEMQKSAKLFDMKKFQANIFKELKCAYPDRRKLEDQCISCIAFVKDANDVLDVPVWVMIINIVALDMLRTKLPPIVNNRRPNNLVAMFDRSKSFQDEDPYSLPANGSSSSGGSGGNSKSNSRPPELPPRDVFGKNAPINLPKPDYGDDSENNFLVRQKTKTEINNKFEDPYYCGFKARVPNFVKRSTQSQINMNSAKTEPPILKKVNSRGMMNKSINNRTNVEPQQQVCDKKSSHYESTNSEPDNFLPKINSSNSISSGYNSFSTDSIRSDNNDIYGINKKLIFDPKYNFNLKSQSSVSLHQMYRNGGAGYVGDWE